MKLRASVDRLMYLAGEDEVMCMAGNLVNEISFPAHIREDRQVQSVKAHCLETAEIAAERLTPVGLEAAARLAGIMHDSGKMTEAFRTYIVKAAAGESVKRGSVNHTFAGVQYLLRSYHNCKDAFALLTSELLAYAVGAHHGQFDVVDVEGQSGFEHRLDCITNNYEEAVDHFLTQCASKKDLDFLFELAVEETKAFVRKLMMLPENTDKGNANREMMFYLGLTARLLLSAVIEGDRRSTADFMQPGPDTLSLDTETRKEIWRTVLNTLERNLATMPLEKPIQQARHRISDLCANFSDQPTGLYRLNVPTGGGKTLSGLRLALAHAEKHSKTHVFYIAPLISILEQNTEAIRKAANCDEWLLEHHSNVIREVSSDKDELRRTELLEESWDAPIISTTLVQFLNTLFSGKTSCVRRFQALTNSVIIIDEVQTVPAHMLSLFNLAMNFLSYVGGSTVLLCSATQPCFEETAHPLRISAKTPVPFDPELWNPFIRTKIMDAGNMRLESIPDLVERNLVQANSLLLVCNKKSEAEELYHRLCTENRQVYHLSASMCVAHRRDMLEQLKEALREASYTGSKVICVSTQLIEAGVDISFDCVIRLCAGMDSVIQSAGRCNRNGEAEKIAPVWIVRCEDEKLFGLQEIQRGKRATTTLLYEFAKHPDRFHDDLASDEAIQFYYRSLFEDIRSDGEKKMDYPVENLRTTLFDLLASNRKCVVNGAPEVLKRYNLRQAFQTAGRLFTVFDDDTQDVIVPYGEGKQLIKQLQNLDVQWQLGEMNALVHKAKSFTVSLYSHQIERLLRQGALVSLCDGNILALAEEYYNAETGLVADRMMNCFLEV